MFFWSIPRSTSAHNWNLSDTPAKASLAQLRRLFTRSFNFATIVPHLKLSGLLQPCRDFLLPLFDWRLSPVLYAYLVRIRDIYHVNLLSGASVCPGGVHQLLSEKKFVGVDETMREDRIENWRILIDFERDAIINNNNSKEKSKGEASIRDPFWKV